MSWIDQGAFQLVTLNGRRYVYRRRPDGGKQEINVPPNVPMTKRNVKAWLAATYKSPEAAAKKGFLTMANMNRVADMMKAAHARKSVSPNKTYGCNIKNRMHHLATNNGKVGFKTLIANSDPEKLNLKILNSVKARQGMVKLDEGKQGVVFMGSFYKNAFRDQFVVKVSPFDVRLKTKPQAADVEYKIQKKLYAVTPNHIAKPLAFFHCKNFINNSNWSKKNSNMNYSDQRVMVSEYINDGTFTNYMSKSGSKIQDKHLESFIHQVLSTLYKIHKKYPEFRHNDLHLDNVLVNPSWKTSSTMRWPTAVINDFGWARLTKTGSNPMVDSGKYIKNWGIGSDTDERYDHHMFLNELRKWVTSHESRFPKTARFLNRAIPEGYRRKDDTYTMNYRLKSGVTYTGLPSLSILLSDHYFRGGSPTKAPSPPKPKPKAPSPPKPKPKAPSPPKPKAPSPPKPKAPSPPKPKKTYTNEELKNLPANKFLKLSPATRARALAIRKGKGKAANLVVRVNKPKNAKSLKMASPVIRISPRTLKSSKFENLIEALIRQPKVNNSFFNKLANNRGKPPVNNYYERRNEARVKAMNVIKARLKAGKMAFSPSPPKPKPKAPSPPKPKPKAPSPPKPKPKAKPDIKASRTPGGRVKVIGPSGRVVYAESLKVNYLIGLAAARQLNVRGKTKAQIAKALMNNI
jgi:hypothetical protein